MDTNDNRFYREKTPAATPGSAALLADATCYIERSKVREILIGQPDENLHITELLLSEIDALPIVTAGDFRLAAKPDEDGVREATIEECAKIARAHKGSAAKRRHQLKIKTLPQDQGALDEILTEERGEDIAAEIIERDIRALSTTGHPKP